MIRADLDGAGATVGPRESARVRTLAHVHHLVTPIAAQAPGAHVVDLALALHPTPAMGGVPKSEAAAFLAAHESIERGWYAAPFGWCDARGHGAFVVGIRSALVLAGEALVYSGAGIVRGSVPELELAETHAKQRAMLSALGVAAVVDRRRPSSGPTRKEAGA
jgi:isochorismate synthase EntC